ncbi:hypothetical protein BDN72DRAFT_965311 [Pluteus cervinus]|uniref:Uncharacterized protein n=1 Tax=Pluteus cervinus TaxID=181527 RepID=A0ACD3A6F2_9AGAR|nr:hypothetical protein BDN72DRAFT_965311 [Pluteus cervinus]
MTRISALLATFLLSSTYILGVAGINEYLTVSNVPKPSTCGNSGVLPAGGWIANKRCGYVMGTAVSGQRFDVEATDSSGYHYGRYRGTGGNFCTFLVPSSMNLSTKTSVSSSCSSTTQSALCNRQHFGKDFDSPPHQGDGAIVIPLNLSGCSGFYNYFIDSTFQTGKYQDPVPFSMATVSSGGYRYSTLDGQASMIRATVPEYGQVLWFFVPRSCIASQLPSVLNNDGGDGC